MKTTRNLATMLAPIGVTPRIREGERRRWCYLLEADRFADLRAVRHVELSVHAESLIRRNEPRATAA